MLHRALDFKQTVKPNLLSPVANMCHRHVKVINALGVAAYKQRCQAGARQSVIISKAIDTTQAQQKQPTLPIPHRSLHTHPGRHSYTRNRHGAPTSRFRTRRAPRALIQSTPTWCGHFRRCLVSSSVCTSTSDAARQPYLLRHSLVTNVCALKMGDNPGCNRMKRVKMDVHAALDPSTHLCFKAPGVRRAYINVRKWSILMSTPSSCHTLACRSSATKLDRSIISSAICRTVDAQPKGQGLQAYGKPF